MDMTNHNYSNLSPPKVRRSYCCDLCGLLTSNPREFLYHQRDVHSMRMNVHECKLCIYASKHIQKLQRHYNLVHRQKMPDAKKLPPSAKNVKAKSVANKPKLLSKAPFSTTSIRSGPAFQLPVKEPSSVMPSKGIKRKRDNMLKCAACNYQTRNKFLLIHHEKTVHLKKKFFRCLKCGYVTNEKARYTKHIKYHSLPKIQCEFCHFKSAYKWNMERHMKNHTMCREGEFNCTLCCFVTHSKQSLKIHVVNHHDDFPDKSNDSSLDKQTDSSVQEDFIEPAVDDTEFEWSRSFESETYDISSELDYNAVPLNSKHDETSSVPWEQDQNHGQVLQCTECDFKSAWTFELRNHEETHKTVGKRHSCPLCGMRFEHIAWLTKHIHRIHKEDSQAKDIAAAFELMKPSRRRPGRSVHNSDFSFFESNLKQDVPHKEENTKQSVLSSLLQNEGPPKYPTMLAKSDVLNEGTSSLPKQQVKHSPPSGTTEEPVQKFVSRKVPACRYCGYRTKWISELEKHMRVHSDEKPFCCSRCNYNSKWKGDLTRHMMKHHGIKFAICNKKFPVPKIRLKKAVPNKLLPENHWQAIGQDTSAAEDAHSSGSEGKEQDSPLDLTVCKTAVFQPSQTSSKVTNARAVSNLNKYRSVPDFSMNSSNSDLLLPSDDTDDIHSDFTKVPCPDSPPSGLSAKQKYFCPFCSFATSTPSRFHVHIVQHYNKKPFMCSVCGYRSNWEWDITKHIRLRGCKDKEHNSACVLLTDETGKRNYEKYEKYLRDVPDEKESTPPPESFEYLSIPSKTQQNIAQENHGSVLAKDTDNTIESHSCADETPVNIVVTPDISFANDPVEETDSMNFTQDFIESENECEIPSSGFKFYLCKHCNYKHSSRKVVIGHLSVHAGVRPFCCRVCGVTSNWRHVIVRHVKEAHNGYMNDVEDRITYIQEGFVIRITSVRSGSKSTGMSSVNGSSQFNCKFCPYKCDKEVYIKFHMKQHKPREGAIFQCTFCPYYVKFKKTLVRHMKLHEVPESQEVPTVEALMQENEVDLAYENVSECTFAMPRNDLSAEEAEMNTEEDSITINYSQLNAPDLQQSIDVAKHKRHVCENCPYRTDNRTQYLYHKQFHRPNNAAPFKCSLCTYWATMQHLLTQHMKVHRDIEQDLIPVSDESFTPLDSSLQRQSESTPSDLSQISVVLVQRGGIVTKMFKCRFCPMMNKKRANVRVHERMHGAAPGDGKYTCSLCNYKCLGQGSLTNHMKIHQSHDLQINNVAAEELSNNTSIETTSLSKKKVFSYFCMRCPAVFKSSSDLYIHKTFHGSTLPFPCPHCDYRAKHKPHLHKHLQVHTVAYVSKRDASFGPPVNPDNDNAAEFLDSEEKVQNSVTGNKKVDQMLLLEVADIKMSMRRGKEFAKRLHKCPFCPSLFFKTGVLAYHLSLHGSSGEFGCSHCDYATTRSANLSVHVQTHTKVAVTPPKRTGRILQCPKCPAMFNKTDRYERHLSLHGKNYRFMCDKCDYSVRFAANLSKHKLMHAAADATNHCENTNNEIEKNGSLADLFKGVDLSTITAVPSEKTHSENLKSPDVPEEKKIYTCDRCPYFQGRKDAVQSHQNRHFQKEGYQCPHCDYRSMGSAFLREHVKSHIQPNSLFPPQTFMKYNKFEIWCKDGETKECIFADKGSEKEPHERFFPCVKGTVDLVSDSDNFDSGENCTSKDPVSGGSSGDMPSVQVSSDVTLQKEVDQNVSNNNEMASDQIQKKLVPKVVLTDIFSRNKAKRSRLSAKESQNKRRETSGREKISGTTSPAKSVSQKQDVKSISSGLVTEKNPPKSSIIVKIKVENIVEDNNERSLYTISSKKSQKAESGSDAASDITLPVDDLEDLSPASAVCEVPVQAYDDGDTSLVTDVDIDCCEQTSENSVIQTADGDDYRGDADPCLIKISHVIGAVPVNKFDPLPSDSHSAEPEIDFLKQLDCMVNGVHLESSLNNDDLPSTDWHS